MKNLSTSELSRRRLVPSKRPRKVPKDEDDAKDVDGPADEGHIASDALNDFPAQKVDDDSTDGEPAESK